MHLHASRQVAQGLYLHAGGGVDGGEGVGGVRERYLLFWAVLGQRGGHGVLGELGDGVGAAVNKVSQNTHKSVSFQTSVW